MVFPTLGARAWAEAEFGTVDVKDRRRTRRVVAVAEALAETPSGTLPQALGDWADLLGAYRLFERPEVTVEAVTAPHHQRTHDHVRHPGEYLLIEDTTALNFTLHPGTTGTGRLGNDHQQGFFLHSCLAVRLEGWDAAGVPQTTVLGLFGQQLWARTTPTGRRRQTKRVKLSRPRESERWAASLILTGPPPAGVARTLITDREGDIYETIERCQAMRTHFIIRAAQARALVGEDQTLFAAVGLSPRLGTMTVHLRARDGRPARTARVDVRAKAVVLRGVWRPGGRKPNRPVTVVEAREVGAPAGAEPLHWVLVTDWPAATFEAAVRVVRAYGRRWLIEEYHRALKTGAQVEKSQLSTAERLAPLIGILTVVAVRLLGLRDLAETRPEERVSAADWSPEALAILGQRYGPPTGGWTHRTLLIAIARLGGFLARKSDGRPGWVTIWRGWRRLFTMVQGALLYREATSP